MSTRSNILVTDGQEKLLFYKHCDGYHTGQEILLKYMQEIKDGKLRNNVSQSAGWLIVFGYLNRTKSGNGLDWQVGDYEPTDYYGSDIEYFYICDIKKMQIQVFSAHFPYEDEDNIKNLRDEEEIKKAIKKGWLKRLGTIKDFKFEKLKKIEEKKENE